MTAQLVDAFSSMICWLPPQAMWLAAVTLVILAATAIIDAFTAKVPDNLLLTGFAILIVGFGLYAGWPTSSLRLTLAIGTAIAFYSANQVWYNYFHKDAIGMGDAKWSALAIMMFGFIPMIISWIIGSWLGLIWLGGARLFGKKPTQVHFAPFLFVGLIIGLYLTTFLV